MAVPFSSATQEFYRYLYYSTVSRMPSWLIGVFFGHLLCRRNSQKNQMSKTLSFLAWSLSLSVMLGLILYHKIFMTNDYSVIRSAFFNTFSRTIWSLSTGLIIFLCSTGHGGEFQNSPEYGSKSQFSGFINTFLSHPMFVVLGKLTYSMFLLNCSVIYVVLGNQKQPGYFSNFQLVNIRKRNFSFLTNLISALRILWYFCHRCCLFRCHEFDF
jgi:peptidoglycan/LPS O-acetylase OafA/YrhL